MKRASSAAFWVTNISPRNVTLADLATNIRAYSTVNLLDSKHYSLTMEQLHKSQESGSLHHKRHFIKLRGLPPTAEPQNVSALVDQNASIPSREKSIYVVETQEYEELQVGDNNPEDRRKIDEQIAQENADLEDEDNGTTIQPPKKV
jgi:hypothetical protein